LASSKLGIPVILDPNAVSQGNVDERSMVLYLSLFYHAFVASESQRQLRREKLELENKLKNMETELQSSQRASVTLGKRNEHLENELEELRKQLEEQALKVKVKPQDVWENYLEQPKSKPPTLTIPFTLEETSAKKIFTVYHIKVEMLGKIWMVKRRYSEFRDLFEKLKKEYPKKVANLKIPGKKLVGNMESDLIEERKLGLQIFLANICAEPNLASSHHFGEFIAKDSIVTLIDKQAFKKQQLEKYERQLQAAKT